MALAAKRKNNGETPHLGRHGGFHGDIHLTILRVWVPSPHANPVGAAR